MRLSLTTYTGVGRGGKPEPGIFTTASDKLGVKHHRAIVVEDGISGVQAGAREHSALVIGVARENNAHGLKANGADFVVEDLAELNLAAISTVTP